LAPLTLNHKTAFPLAFFLYADLHKEKTTSLSCTCMACVQNKKTIQNKMFFLSDAPHLRKIQNIELSLCWVCPHLLLKKNTRNYDAIVNPMHPKFQRFAHICTTPFSLGKTLAEISSVFAGCLI
jgi:hypothetical protein